MNETQNKTTAETEALRKDWYVRISKAIDKLDTTVDALGKETGQIREALKEYSDKGIEKLDTVLRKKIESFLEKIDVVRADSYDEIRQLREDIKEEKADERIGRRWFIGIVLGLALAAITAVGGYFVSVEVINNKVENIEQKIDTEKTWRKEHHDKLESGFNVSLRNRVDIDQLRAEVKEYVSDQLNEKKDSKK